jgi:hypothetical protein
MELYIPQESVVREELTDGEQLPIAQSSLVGVLVYALPSFKIRLRASENRFWASTF